MLADDKKGVTVKIDADLHAEVRQFVEQNGMTMAEFVTLALVDELHPKIQQKEKEKMGNMRTMAFQVPEEMFQRIKGYLQRNNISQKQFVLGLIEEELDREQAERENMGSEQNALEETEEDEISEDAFAEDMDETENTGFTMGGM
ncbi:MAG: hypothetical protein IJB65_00875 [Clostridia bacterium]|nr:hypothetical protein [Clostridia bacterium]